MARGVGYALGRHIAEAHLKGNKEWVSCWICWLGYSSIVSFQTLVSWKFNLKKYNITMSETLLSWVLVIIGLSLPPVIAVLLDHYFKKKKIAAETEKIQLQNKITKEITYDQLKTQSKQKDIKGKIEILTQLTRLEEEIKSKTTKTDSDQKKLSALEMLKKEFKETLVEGQNKEETGKPLLVKKDKKKQSRG